MKIGNATIEIRKRGLTEIIDLAVLFYRRHMGVLLGITTALGIPLVGLAVAIHYLTDKAWVSILVYWFTLSIPRNGVMLAASRLVFGTNLGVGQALSLYRSVWFGLFTRMLGQKLLVALLSVVLIGPILWLRWVFTPMIVVLERLSGRPMAVRRAGLNRRGGGAGRAFAMALLLGLIRTVIVLGIVLFLEFILGELLVLWSEGGFFDNSVFSEPPMLAMWMIADLLLVPFSSLSWFFLYLNARISGEGWDLELGFKTAAGRIPQDREAAV